MNVHLVDIDLDSDPSRPPSRFWEGASTVDREDCLEEFGYDDLAVTDNESRVERLRDQRDMRRAAVLALSAPPSASRLPATGDSSVDADDVLGYVFADAPLHDNEHMGYLELAVRPRVRGRGIGSALLERAEEILTAQGRTTLVTWGLVTKALSDEAEGTIPDPAGTVRISVSHPATRFPLRRGYAFSQAERHSVQPLPVPSAVLSEALAEATAKADGYELVQFVGMPPEELVEGLAPLFQAMSTDPPLGAVDWHPETWDAARVVRAYEEMTIGRDVYTAVARHVATGELAAFTQLKGPRTQPEVVFQENTLVLQAHRGHALGLWVKAANCRTISRDRPTSRRVHTWNADENDHMLAINTRLGYRQESIAAAWQKVVDA